MMDKPELIEKAECELDDWIKRCHTSGLNYWEILRLILLSAPKLMMQAEAEKFVKEKKN